MAVAASVAAPLAPTLGMTDPAMSGADGIGPNRARDEPLAGPSNAPQNIDQSDANGHDSSAGTSNGNGGTLFNADEVRFMSDSLSSADSFDPFTNGAPGFKVPNVLPPHLGGIGSMPGEQQEQNRASQHLPRVSGAGQDMDAFASSSKGGYGQDRSWQQQQLEALQAGRSRYLHHQNGSSGPSPFSTLIATTQHLPDVSSIGQSLQGSQGNRPSEPYASHGGQQGQYPQHYQHSIPYGPGAMGGSHYPQAMQHPMPHMMPPYPAMYNPGPGDARAANPALANVALQFPSSHDFPHGEQAKRQRVGTHQSIGSQEDDRRRGRSPSARPPWAAPPDMAQMQASSGQRKAAMPKAASSATAALAGTMEADAPYVFEPAPRPPPTQIDLDKAEQASFVPDDLKTAYFGTTIRRLQPHLQQLRREQVRRKALGFSANIRKSNKQMAAREKDGGADGTLAADVSDDDEDGADGKDKKKQPHVLLTEAEKKANHIASEQKRRANIRKGYEMLCEMVPALQEGAAGQGDGDEDGEDDEDDEEDDDENADVKRGKKRGLDTKISSGGGAAGTDSKGGARSEATILMHAVEHIRAQLQLHRDLLVRREEAQKRIAAQHGADVIVKAPTPMALAGGASGGKGQSAAAKKRAAAAAAASVSPRK